VPIVDLQHEEVLVGGGAIVEVHHLSPAQLIQTEPPQLPVTMEMSDAAVLGWLASTAHLTRLRLYAFSGVCIRRMHHESTLGSNHITARSTRPSNKVLRYAYSMYVDHLQGIIMCCFSFVAYKLLHIL
jgi:hypothetical protein